LENISEQLETLINQFSDEDTKLCLENRFPYLYTKAYYFNRDGPESYASSDAFNLPDSSFSSEDIELLKLGCKQILEGKGFSSKNPFRNLGIRGCHKLFELFHFKFTNQQVTKVPDGMLDNMTFKHVVDNKGITYYNLV
tara:strand:+ start:928 stop:1344 length:417 start_codon:yes stop_codon:yes gene_type:complete